MILGMTPYTFVHTLISLIALAAGFVVMFGLFRSMPRGAWTALFFVTAIATSVTGFGFASASFGASHWIGVISLIVLAVAVLARYAFHYAGRWRALYAIGTMLAFYFLVFVTVAQLFQKVPALAALAPTLTEPPFAYAQAGVLLVFIALTVLAVVRFRGATVSA